MQKGQANVNASFQNLTYCREQMPNANAYAFAWSNVWETGTGERAYKFANEGYKVTTASIGELKQRPLYCGVTLCTMGKPHNKRHRHIGREGWRYHHGSMLHGIESNDLSFQQSCLLLQ